MYLDLLLCVVGQIIDSLQSVRWSDGQPLEALLPSTIDDPGIIRTVAQKVIPDEQEGGRLSVVWLIMEWCEHGDLGVCPLLTIIYNFNSFMQCSVWEIKQAIARLP